MFGVSTPKAFSSGGPILLIVSALLFGAMALATKKATARLPAAEVAFGRFVFGVASVLSAVVAGVRLRPVNYRGLFLRGLFGGLAVLLYFGAVAHLPVGMATLLNYTSPIFTAIFAAIFLRERVAASTGFALLLAFCGMVMVVRGHASPGEIGFGRWEAAGLGSAILSGAAVATIRGLRRTDGSWEIFGAFCIVGVLATAPPAIAGWVRPSAIDLLLLALVGLLSVVAQVLFIYALRYVAAASSGVISQLTPVTSLMLGMLILGDRPAPLSLAGSVVTLVGVAWGARPIESQRT